MNGSSGSSSPLQLAVPISLLVCLLALGSAQADAVTAAETLYLAVLATAALLPLFLLPGRTEWTAEGAALLVGAAVWALPEGGVRAATVGLLLTAALLVEAVAASRRWALASHLETAAAASRQPATTGAGSLLATLVALALATQMIARGELLLAPSFDPRTLVSLVGLPLTAAVAAWLLHGRYGRPIWIALPLLVAVGPGFRVAPTLTLAAFAAVALAARRRREGWLLLATVLAAAAFWRWPFALVLVLACGVLLAAERTGWKLGLAAVAGALALVPGIAPAPLSAEALVWLLLLVPLAPLAPRGDAPTLLAAAALGALGGRWFGGAEALPALAPALALIALRPETRAAGSRSSSAFELQALWGALLFAGSLLLAGYPWLRTAPLGEALALVGVPVSWLGAAIVATAVCLLALVPRTLPLRPRAIVSIGLVALFVAAFLRLPEPGLDPFGGEVFLLDAASSAREIELPPGTEVESVTLDSYLSNGVLVAPGTEVARLVLSGDEGERIWSVRAGVDSGEWAIRRHAGATAAPPAAWLSWVSPDGFFAQRYRQTRGFEPPAYPERLRLELAPGMPPELELAVFGVRVR